MARPCEFNRDRALEAAMQLFWRQGYSATSLSQLLDAMAIGRSSFYAAFTDKRSLYVEALTLFAERTYDILHALGDEQHPTAAIQLFFEHTLFKIPEQRMRRGCMMINTVLELAAVDRGLSQLAAKKLGVIEADFEHRFRHAIDKGRISSTHDPKRLAKFVMTVNQGLRVASRTKATRQELDDVLDTMLSLLRLAA